MTTSKPRTNITLFPEEKLKLEKLSEIWGLSQSRVIGRLLRESEMAKLANFEDTHDYVQTENESH